MADRPRSGFVDFDWGQVHIRSAGDPALPAVLLLHQNPLSTTTYEAVLTPLGERFHAIAVDTPGFGRSDAPGGAWTVPQYAELVREVVRRVGLARPLVVGQHTGACMAIEMALQAPDAVAGLVLIGVPCVAPDLAASRLHAKEPYQVAADGSHLPFLWHRMNEVQYPGQLPPELATRHLADHLLAGPENYLHAYRAVYTYPIQQRLTDLASAGTATLLLAGEHDCIKEIHDSTEAFLPDAPAVTLPGLSDFIMDEDPAEFVRQVSHFADRLSPPKDAPDAPDATVVHTSVVTVSGGRGGEATSESGHLRLTLARPAERGAGAGTDPEELFAAGFAACFDSSLAGAARRERLRIGPTRTRATISLLASADQQYSISADLRVEAPQSSSADLAKVIEVAKGLCPYSKAIQGNVDLVVTGVSSEGDL